MAKEYPASKTQIAKATEIGIDLSDQPGYTTLGARLEAAGWSKDGKTQTGAGAATPASDYLAYKATPEGQMTYRQRMIALQKEREARRAAWRAESDEDDEGRPLYKPAPAANNVVYDDGR